jgi:hypothetical protein
MFNCFLSVFVSVEFSDAYANFCPLLCSIRCFFFSIYLSNICLSVRPFVSSHFRNRLVYVPHSLTHYVGASPSFSNPTLYLPISKFLFESMLNNPMEQSPCLKADMGSASQIPRISCNYEFHYRAHKSSSHFLILSRINPVHAPINFDVILPSTPRSPQWSLSYRLPQQNPA